MDMDPSTGDGRRRKLEEELQRKQDFQRHAPRCMKCLGDSIVKTSRSEANPGRLFYCCAERGCDAGWLMWCEDIAAPPAAAVPPPPRAGPPSAANGANRSLTQRLVDAAHEGDVRTLRACLAEPGARALLDAEALARRGKVAATALRYAAFHGHSGCVRSLLHAGALPGLCNTDDPPNDALTLARLGRGHPRATGPPVERAGTIAALEAATAADAWQVHGISIKPELNGLIVRIVKLADDGKALVREAAAPADATVYKLSREKLRRQCVEPGERGSIVGLANAVLNGCAVRVTKPLDQAGRYTVRLEQGAGVEYPAGNEIRVKRENLAPASSSA